VNPSQVSDGDGGAVYVWEDHRNGTNYDIYSNHLYSNGSPLVGLNELTDLQMMESVCYPNPLTLNSVIKIKNNAAQPNLPWVISIYDSFGRTIKTQKLEADASFVLNSSEFGPGIYFYTIIFENTNYSSRGSFIASH
jgi:hypothetical protein